jgi:hypothetical protein
MKVAHKRVFAAVVDDGNGVLTTMAAVEADRDAFLSILLGNVSHDERQKIVLSKEREKERGVVPAEGVARMASQGKGALG